MSPNSSWAGDDLSALLLGKDKRESGLQDGVLEPGHVWEGCVMGCRSPAVQVSSRGSRCTCAKLQAEASLATRGQEREGWWTCLACDHSHLTMVDSGEVTASSLRTSEASQQPLIHLFVLSFGFTLTRLI